MEKEVKAAVITGICAIIAAVIGGAMSGNGLKKAEYPESQSVIQQGPSGEVSSSESDGDIDDRTSVTGETIKIQTPYEDIFELSCLNEGKLDFIFPSKNVKDAMGNMYPAGYMLMYDGKQNSRSEATYPLNQKYSTLSGEIALCYDDKDIDEAVWVEFLEKGKIISKTDKISSDIRSVSFALDVSQISELTIHLNGGSDVAYLLTQGFYLE